MYQKKGTYRRLNTERFIEEARKIHGDKYDYSLVEYTKAETRVKIVCPKHGVFEQIPHSHLSGRGCRQCFNERYPQLRWRTTEQFIEDARKIHGDKYDYSKTKYMGRNNNIIITCPIHGNFKQKADSHLLGYGCPKCGTLKAVRHIALKNSESLIEKYEIENMKQAKKIFATLFFDKAKRTHKNKYDYSQAKYVDSRTKIKIICPKHGAFWMAPKYHIGVRQSSGCPKCAMKQKSQPQEKMKKELIKLFGEKDVCEEYNKDKRYPFFADFYIKSLDLFIELNAHWTHYKEFYNSDSEQHKKILDKWIDGKKRHNRYYSSAIKVWTKRDPKKLKTAQKNNINYIVFWKSNLTDFHKWVKLYKNNQIILKNFGY